MEEQLLNQAKDGGSIPTSPLQLTLKLVDKKTATEAYRRWHYFGDKGFLATYNFGVYYNDELYGAISYGIPNAPAIKGLYTPKTQSDFMELTRLALSDQLPKNSESRVIAVSLRLLRKLRPSLKGVITYADTAYGHTGTIYKACNFKYLGLTAPKTDLFIDGKRVGKLKGVKYSELKGEWRPRSRKHLFVKFFNEASVKINPTPPLHYVYLVKYSDVHEVLERGHYLGGVRGAIYTLRDGYGAIAVWANLRSRKLADKLTRAIELVRLYAPPEYPHGKLSRFVGGCLRWLRQNTDYVYAVSYTDPNVGHEGIIYKATNWVFDGLSAKDGHPILILDGKNKPSRTFFDKHGTQSIAKLKEIYGERLQIKPKLQKKRFIYVLRRIEERRC